jgi:hypothetical protein
VKSGTEDLHVRLSSNGAFHENPCSKIHTTDDAVTGNVPVIPTFSFGLYEILLSQCPQKFIKWFEFRENRRSENLYLRE